MIIQETVQRFYKIDKKWKLNNRTIEENVLIETLRQEKVITKLGFLKIDQ